MITAPQLLEILSTKGVFFSYAIIFILMFVEGPIVTYIAAFLSSLGFLNIWIVFILSFLGNQIADVMFFKIGGSLRKNSVEKLVSYLGLNKGRINWLERNLKKHFIKTTLITKTVPPLPTPGILLSGFLRIPFKKFFWIYTIYNLFYAILFVSMGYFFGYAVSIFLKYLKLTEHILLVLLVSSIVIYLLIRWIYSRISKNINKGSLI